MTYFRFGDFKFGEQRFTGDKIPLTWYIYVDWDGDGYFEADESARVVGLTANRGRAALLTSASTGRASLARMRVGMLTIEFDNYDRRFSPWYASSPLYPNVLPGREVKIQVKAFGATTYDVFRGRIDDIRPTSSDSVQVMAVDGWQLLSDHTAVTQLRTSTTADVCIGDVLTAVDWPSSWGRDLDTGTDTLSYMWADEQTAYDVIHELNEVEQGMVYVAADGTFTFDNRSSLYATSADFDLAERHVGRDIWTNRPWANIRNYTSVTHTPREVQSTAAIWALKDTPAVAAGDSLTLWARFVDASLRYTPAQNVATPVATTDYTMNSASDGSGTDMTGNFTVAMTTYAARAKLVITNNDVVTGYVTKLQVRGDAIMAQDAAVSVSEDSASQAAYSLRQLDVDSMYLQSTATAQNLAGALVSWLASPTPSVEVTLTNVFALQFGLDLGSIIHFTSGHYGIDANFRLAHIEHHTLGNMQAIETRWTLESLPTSADVWKLGVVGHSEIGTTTYLVY